MKIGSTDGLRKTHLQYRFGEDVPEKGAVSIHPERVKVPRLVNTVLPAFWRDYRYSIPSLEGNPVCLTLQVSLVLLCEYKDNQASYSLEVAHGVLTKQYKSNQ